MKRKIDITMKKPTTQPKKTRESFDKYFFVTSLVVLGFALLTLLAASVLAADKKHIPYEGVHAGKAISTGVTTLTVEKVERKPGSKPFIAPAGYEYLIVTLKVQNNSDEPFSVVPTADTYVKSAAGKVSYIAPYTLTDPFHSGIVLPGEATTGELSYLVQKNSSYKFYVEADWSSTAVPFRVLSSEGERS